MNDCIFCKIIAGEIPSYKLYEDADTYAFLDIHPNNPGHTLVLPKMHYRNVLDVPEDTWFAVMKTVRKLAPVIKEATNAGGINVHVNNEPAANQAIFHLHVHVIPRYEGDPHRPFTPGTFATEEQPQELVTAITRLLA